MATLTIRLDPQLEKQLAALAKTTKRQKSEIVREALRREVAEISSAVPSVAIARLDPQDAAIVLCAARAGAEAFVTGDQKVLATGTVESMAILSPRALWERLRESRT